MVHGDNANAAEVSTRGRAVAAATSTSTAASKQNVRSPRIDADLAYEAIQAQLHAGFDDDDDDDDDDDEEMQMQEGYDMDVTMAGQEQKDDGVHASSFSSSTPFSTFKSPGGGTAKRSGSAPISSTMRTPGSSFTLPSTFRYSPVQTPAAPPHSAASAGEEASPSIFTPATATATTTTPFSKGKGGGIKKPPIPDDLRRSGDKDELIVFDPKKRSKIGSYKSKAFAEDEAYHNAFQLYLEQKSSIEQRYAMWNEKKEVGEDGISTAMIVMGEETTNVQMEEQNLMDEMRQNEIKFLEDMSNICSDRENDRIKHSFEGSSSNNGRTNDKNRSDMTKGNNQKEYDAWTLMTDLLKNHGVEGLLLENESSSSTGGISSSNLPAVWRTAPPNFFQTELFPAQMVHKALKFPLEFTNVSGGTTPSLFEWTLFLLQRRFTTLRWLEHIYAVHLPSDVSTSLPPSDQNIMWTHTLSAMEHSAAGSSMGKQLNVLTLDTPYHMLDFQDAKEDADLLRGVLMYMQCGQLSEAQKLCIEAGQPWRAATLAGGIYHGLRQVKTEDDDDNDDVDNHHSMEEEEKKSDEEMVEIGNPQRREWKKQCQLMAQSLEQVMQRSTRQGAAAALMTPAVVYEAALYAILARDVPRAVSNPFMRNWISTLWIYMNALVDSTCDSVLEQQALMRAEKGRRFPYPGTTEVFGESSLNDYSDSIHSLKNEEVVLGTMATSAYANVKEEATTDVYRLCASAILIGKHSIVEYIADCVAPRCEGDSSTTTTYNVQQLSPSTLRFAAHFVLLMYCSYSNKILDNSNRNGGETEKKMMLIVQRYIESLIRRRHLSLVALYTSLLPLDALIETYVNFLLVIDDEEERRSTLDQAREKFDTNVDLMILRKVVSSCIFEQNTISNVASRGGEDDRLVKVRLNQSSSDEGNEDEAAHYVSIWESDVKKIRSIRWLCFYLEHRLDAVIFTNALLRQLLLASFEEDSTSPKQNDKTTLRLLLGQTINACKVFVTNFFPPPSESENILKASVDRAVELGVMPHDDVERLASNCQAALHEYTALIAFLEAHTAFEEWTQVMSLCRESQPVNPIPADSGRSEYLEGKSVEAEVAQQNKLRRYKRTMAELARTVLRNTMTVQETLTKILTFDGIWMDPNGGPGVMDTSSSCPPEWRTRERLQEMKILQSMLLPQAVFMLHAVLDGTASWASTFYLGAASSLPDIVELLVDFEDATWLGPVYWQRRLMQMAEFVSSDDHYLAQHMNAYDLEKFLTLMADGAIMLSRFFGH